MFTNSTLVSTKQDQQVRELPRFEFPEITENEEVFDYVTAVKQESPLEYFQIGSVNFEKRVFPSKASETAHKNEYFAPMYLVRKMSVKQASVLNDRAKQTYVRIPSRRNPKFDPIDKKCEELEEIPAVVICLADYIILCKTTEFNPIELPKQVRNSDDKVEADPRVVQQELPMNLMQENAKRKK
jgi:hypothetical protein